ncbi:hypothetical protein D3C87_1934990 [compost metagenome]
MQVVVARIVGEDRPDADDRHLGLPGAFEHIGHRTHVDQHGALGSAVGKERRMDLIGSAAQPVRQEGRDMVDVGIVLALHAARRRDHLDIEAP